MDPTVYGDYPEVMKKLIGKRLPSFTATQSKKLKGSFDFVGVNYYSAFYIKNVVDVDPNIPNWRSDAHIEWKSQYFFSYKFDIFIICFFIFYFYWLTSFFFFVTLIYETEQNKAGQILGPRGGSEWDFLYPQGLRKFLNYAKNKYGSPKFMITENGKFYFIFTAFNSFKTFFLI